MRVVVCWCYWRSLCDALFAGCCCLLLMFGVVAFGPVCLFLGFVFVAVVSCCVLVVLCVSCLVLFWGLLHVGVWRSLFLFAP